MKINFISKISAIVFFLALCMFPAKSVFASPAITTHSNLTTTSVDINTTSLYVGLHYDVTAYDAAAGFDRTAGVFYINSATDTNHTFHLSGFLPGTLHTAYLMNTDNNVQVGSGHPFTTLSTTSTSAGVLSISNGSTYNFGSHAVGSTNPFTFTITNTGTANVVFTGVPPPALPFAFNGGSCSALGSSPLLVGASCTVIVIYSPTTSGVHTSSFSINYKDPTVSHTVTRAITGTGTSTTSGGPVAPTALPTAGSFTAAQTITLASTTSGATIHYSVDGSVATCSSALYSSPFTITATTTVQSIACTGTTPSSVSSFVYTITTTGGDGGGPTTGGTNTPLYCPFAGGNITSGQCFDVYDDCIFAYTGQAIECLDVHNGNSAGETIVSNGAVSFPTAVDWYYEYKTVAGVDTIVGPNNQDDCQSDYKTYVTDVSGTTPLKVCFEYPTTPSTSGTDAVVVTSGALATNSTSGTPPADLSSNNGGLTAPCPDTVGCQWKELLELINKVVKFIIFDLAVPIAAIMFMYAGFLMVTAGEESASALKKAKDIFGGTVKGIVLAAGAWLIIEIILTTLGYNGSWIGF